MYAVTLTSAKGDTYLAENISTECKFVFSNFFKNFVQIKDNKAIFSISKSDPNVQFAKTDELEASIQITTKKINNPKSPTVTLFMALERGKKYGNFIIPNLRQNLCNGKFQLYNATQKRSVSKIPQISSEKNKSKQKIIISDIKPLKTKTFNMGNFNFNSLEKIKVSSDFPKYRISGEESCKSNKSTNNKWKNTIIFFADENLVWGVKNYYSGLGVRIYMGTRKNDKIIFKVIEAHKKWKNMLNWINGYSLDVKNKSIVNAFNQTLKGNYASSGSYRRKCEIRFSNLIKTQDTIDHLKNIKFLETRQKASLRLMDKFGIRFAQKYDFEAVQIVVEDLYKKELRQVEEKARKLADEKARKLAEEKAKRKAEEKAKREAEEKAKLKAEEKAKRKAEQKAKKIAEEKAKKLAKEKAVRETKEKARKLAEEKAKSEAEDKAKKLAKEKARKLADEKAKSEADEKARKLAEEKAKSEAEEKTKREIFVSKLSEKYYQTMVSMKDIFDVGEAYIKNHSKIDELNKIKVTLDDYLKKPFEEYDFLSKEKYAKLHVEYTMSLFKFYNEELKLGKIPNQNDFINGIDRYILNQKKYLNSFTKKFENKIILEEFTNKFPVTDWPTDIDKMLTRIEKFNVLNKNIILASKSNDIWNKFIYPSNIHIKQLKSFELEMEDWIKKSSEKFKSFYNKRMYDLSVQKNIDQLKNTQDKDEDFFNKIGN